MSEHEDALWFWQHAETALSAARRTVDIDASTASNRAYYAAFYAVSALFAAEGQTYTRHSGIEAAVHRDLVNTGRWSKDLGTAFSELQRLRMVTDYDVSRFPSVEEAREAVRQAEVIIKAVKNSFPELGQRGPTQDAGP